MNLELKDLSKKVTEFVNVVRRYIVLIFIVVLCAIYGFLTVRINSLTQVEPSPDAVAEKLQTVKRPRVDQEALDKMQQLEEQNVQVKTLFQEARKNPFSE